MADIQEIVKQIEELSIMQVSELVKALEDKFGISAAAPVAVAAAGSTDSNQPVEEEKTDYTVVLTEAGSNKINVIKAIREINPNLGLKEAKELVDSAPANVAENIPVQSAKEMQQKLETAGAKVELK